MRRNGGTRQAHGSSKLHRKETKFPNSWMNMRKYATKAMRIFLDTITTMRMILSMGALRYPTKVYTLLRLFIFLLTQSLQFTVSTGTTDGQAAPTEELASYVIHIAQAQAPDIQAANGEVKATYFQRATDSKELFDDPAPAAESSPWRPASLPFTFFDDTPYNLTGGFVRLPRWSFGTHVRSALMLYRKLPGLRMP